jgi:non-specific serine/threonine protein kinase
MQDRLVLFLRSREALLVLDNCEHLREACGELADRLLRACPHLKVLVSSRIPLGIEGEAVFRVPSLSYPERRPAVEVEDLLGYSAVRLLVERVRLSLPDYQVSGKNGAALVRICRRLDGIPLALELAAARLNVLTADQVAERLEHAFHFLTGGKRAALR